MSPYRTVNVSKLTPGDTLGEPVFNEGLTKLLGSGCAVSEQLIRCLAERGVTEVVVQIPAEHTEKNPRRVLLSPSNDAAGKRFRRFASSGTFLSMRKRHCDSRAGRRPTCRRLDLQNVRRSLFWRRRYRQQPWC